MSTSSRRLFLAFTLALAAPLAACAGASDAGSSATDDDNEAASATKLLTAKLYDDPRHEPNAFCDLHTEATLYKARSGRLFLELQERLSETSACELAVSPNKRRYTVTASSDCGSTVHAGTRGADAVKLMDHRTRLCEDYRPQPIELEETRTGATRRLFGKPSGAAPDPATPSAKVLDVKLYDQPRAQPSPSCDRHTHLVVTKEGGKLVAKLDHVLSPTSLCEIAVVPDPRSYVLSESSSCGSKVYKGANGADAIEIQDNATRLCEDVRPAGVEVKETRGGRTLPLYSSP